MKKIYINVPTNSSAHNNGQRMRRNITDISSENSINSDICYTYSNYDKNEYPLNKTKKTNKNIICINEKNFPSRNLKNISFNNSNDSHKLNFNIRSYEINAKTAKKNENLNNNIIFNDNQNNCPLKHSKNISNNDISNLEKSRVNYTYYESKYSKNPNKENIPYINQINDENVNTLNLINKNNNNAAKKSAYNSSIKNNDDNPYFHIKLKSENLKTVVSSTEEKSKKRNIIIKNKNIINSNQKGNTVNKYELPHSIPINYENSKDIYFSPMKQTKDDKNANSIIRQVEIEKNNLNKCFEKMAVKNLESTQKKDRSKNISQKSMTYKFIPITPKEKVNTKQMTYGVQNINNNTSILNSKEKDNRLKSLHSNTTSRLQDSQIIQSNQLNINQNLNKIKGRNLFNNENFKKTSSSKIFYSSKEKINEKDNNSSKSKIQAISCKTLNEENNKNLQNILVNDKCKEIHNSCERSRITGNEKLIKKMNSHQFLTINKTSIEEDLKNKSVISKKISQNFESKDISKNNEFNRNNLTRKNTNDLLRSKTNPSSSQNSYKKIDISEKEETKQKGRNLSDFLKYESIPVQSGNIKKDICNNEEEDEWDKTEYMGMRKQTYDPGRKSGKRIKNNLTNLMNSSSLNNKFAENTFIKSCEYITVPGRNESGNKKTNQDTYVIERNINGILNFNIFGVLDGHGEYGHYASQFVSRFVVNRIKNNPSIKKCDEAKEIYKKLTSNGYEIIANIFTDADVQIQKEKFDCTNSGTTCIIIIQLEEKIICANAGDSRGILILDKNDNDNLLNSKIYNLSYDCKPDLPNEKQRIYECGGCVEKATDENGEEGGPFRVWALGEEYPGLAMSRSIGDLDAKKIGVIPNPQIVEYTLCSESKYMMVASDGIWEFISNEEAMRIGNKFYLRNDAAGLCKELYEKSLNLWRKEDCVVDDITLVVVFF